MDQNNNEINNNVQQPVEPTVQPAPTQGGTPFDAPPVAAQPVQQPIMPPVTEAPKKKSVLPIIIIVVLIAVIVGLCVFLFLPKQPKKKLVVDKTIDTLFSKASAMSREADKIVTDGMKLNLAKEPFHFEGTLNMSVSGLPSEYKELEKIKDYDFIYDFSMDAPNEKATGALKITQSGKSIIDGKLLIEGSTAYFEENNILGANPVKTDIGENFFETLNLDDITQNVGFDGITKSIDGVAKHIKNAIPVDMIKTANDNVNGTKATKTYIELSEANIAKIYSNFYNSVVNDAELLENISSMTGSSIDQIKQALKESLDEVNQAPSNEVKGEFAIYTDSSNKLLKLVLNVDNVDQLVITNSNGVYDIKLADMDANTKITYDENANKLTFSSKEVSFEVSYKDETLDAKVNYQGCEFVLSIKSKNTKDSYSSDIKLNGKVKVENDTYQFELKTISLVNKNQPSSSINPANAVSADSLNSETVATNIQNALSGTIFESIYNMFMEESNTSYSNYSSYGDYDDWDW